MISFKIIQHQDNNTDARGKYRNVPIVKGKLFACKKCNDRNNDSGNDLKKIQLVKDPELPLFIIIKSNAITDIPNPFQELGDLVFGPFK
jgi:hypothetical protein